MNFEVSERCKSSLEAVNSLDIITTCRRLQNTSSVPPYLLTRCKKRFCLARSDKLRWRKVSHWEYRGRSSSKYDDVIVSTRISFIGSILWSSPKVSSVATQKSIKRRWLILFKLGRDSSLLWLSRVQSHFFSLILFL